MTNMWKICAHTNWTLRHDILLLPEGLASCKLVISWTYLTNVVVNILFFSWPGCFLLWHKLFKPYKTSPAVLRVSDIMHSVGKSYKLQCVDLENENWEVRRILVLSKHLFQLIHFYLSPLNHGYSLGRYDFGFFWNFNMGKQILS